MAIPVPGIVTLSATGNTQLTVAGTGMGPDGWLITVVGTNSWSGSLVLKSNQSPPGSANNLVNVGYFSGATYLPITAGTAITSGTVPNFVRDTAYDLWVAYTHTAGQVTLIITPANNASQGGAGPFPGVVNAGDVTSGTFGAFSGDTGIYSFPSQVGIGTAGLARNGLRVRPTVTISVGNGIGLDIRPTFVVAANGDQIIGGSYNISTNTPGTFTGIIGTNLLLNAFSTAGWTSPADPLQLDIQAITGTGSTNAYGIRIAPPTGATNNYAIAHTTPSTFNVLASGAITTASTITAGGAVTLGGTATTSGAGVISLGGVTRTTIGANGAATALTAAPLGYLDVYIAGTAAQIPFYNRGA